MRLSELASVIRSKNAGPFELTFDVLFNDLESYHRVVNSECLSAQRFAALYKIAVTDVLSVVHFLPALAIKITIRRSRGSGDLGETDVYGAQQHGPLLDVVIPEDTSSTSARN